MIHASNGGRRLTVPQLPLMQTDPCTCTRAQRRRDPPSQARKRDHELKCAHGSWSCGGMRTISRHEEQASRWVEKVKSRSNRYVKSRSK
eukprot:3109587-Pleurochrysis_carterae.AAC.1